MEKRMDILYVVIPAYNEEENIKTVISDWYKVVEAHSGGGQSRLVVVDDGSTDHTAGLLKEEAAKRPLLTVLHKENGGHGQAVLYGYNYAIAQGADYVFQTDSDGQTIPSEFEPFWRQRKRFDMVIGRRSARQDGFMRICVTRVLRLILLLSFRRWIEDANTPFRLMRADVLAECLKYLDEGETLTNVMISAAFAKKRKKVLYRTITFRERQGGSNSINLKKISAIGFESLSRFMTLNARLENWREVL